MFRQGLKEAGFIEGQDQLRQLLFFGQSAKCEVAHTSLPILVEGRASVSYLSQAMRPTMSVASAVIT